MRIALATLNGNTVTAHFGRTKAFAVVNIEDGTETSRELRRVGSPDRSDDPESGRHRRHDDLIRTIEDCDVVIAGGMGFPIKERAEQAGIEVVLTGARSIDEAVQQYASGTLAHDPDRVHAHGGGRH